MKIILLYFALLTTSSLFGQVTIGSHHPPIDGALLDLKEFPSNAEGVTSTKGLGLPRVALEAINSLHPMVPTHTAGTLDEARIGLLVYHLADYCHHMIPAIYVWDGEQWVILGDAEVPQGENVKQYNDQDGNEFLAGQFGTAGEWMLQNLAATRYDPIRDGADIVPGNTLQGPVFSQTDYTVEGWCYPGGVSAGDNSKYNEIPAVGLLYTWAAATRGRGGVTGVANITPADPLEPIQGICPTGWHLPSRTEWLALHAELKRAPLDYAISQSTSASILMRNGCVPIKNTGQSKIAKSNGFSGMLVGYAQNTSSRNFGVTGVMWTSSVIAGNASNALVNEFSGASIASLNYNRHVQVSVRCKRNN